MRLTNDSMLRGIAASVISLALLAGAGCKQSSTTANQPGPRSDQQVANDIQSKINAESALNGQDIQVGVQGGIATLNGSVTDNASRSLAANDAGNVPGVKTVINNLTVQPQQQAMAQTPEPAPVPAAPPARVTKPTPSRHDADRRRHRHDDDADNNDNRNGRDDNRDAGNTQIAQQQAPPPPQADPEPVHTVPAPPPPPRPVVKTVTLPEGTVVPVRVSETLDSAHTQANDTFHGSLAGDLIVDGMIAIPQGSAVSGRVVDAKDAGHFKGSSLLSIEVTQISARGREVSVVTDAYTKQGAGRGKNTAEKAGGGAALGAIIGAIAGGGKGAAIGAATGGGVGAGVNGVTRGQQVQIESESLINFRLQSPVTVSTSQRVGGPRPDDNDNGPQLERRSQ